ncbi:MAG: hypothetical protein R3258_09065 [Acidimicrobiia bacterium]|nr:hypothetical protein [Acidimicrobiia bacterium]
MSPRTLSILTALALALAGCGSGNQVVATPTSTTTTTTTVPPATTTTSSPTTTTAPSTALGRLLETGGYTVSDDWVVETVIPHIDAGTGGIALDEAGVIYQSDFGYSGHDGNSVYRIDAGGSLEVFSQSEDFGSLTMITFGADGRLYQSSYGTGKVFVLDSEGNPEEIASNLFGPTGIVALEDGTLFVESYNSNLIHRIEPDGTVSEWASHPAFNGPNGLTMGPDGTLYAVNHRDGGLFAIDQDGNVTEIHRFVGTTSHVVYHDGGLFVTGRGRYVIFRYDLGTGAVEVVAGNAEFGDKDGRGTEASFGRPNAITVGPDGALYFNHGSRRSPDPVTIRRLVYDP